MTLRYPVMPVRGTSRLGLFIDATIFGVRLSTAWPACRDVLHARPDAEQFHYLDFAREASLTRETVTVRVRVEYGSSDVWDEGGRTVAAIREIDRRRGEPSGG